MACVIPDDTFHDYVDRLKGQTVIITGAANGIGKRAALSFAAFGANVVIGDLDTDGAAKTVTEIVNSGGNASFQSCNVVVYEDLLSLFDFAMKTYSRVDVVIPNAGVAEVGSLTDVRLDEKGKPIKPTTKTIEINLIGVTYTIQLAYYFLKLNKNPDSLRRLVLVGSMASIMGMPGAPVYSASKHAILGLMRALKQEFEISHLHITTVCPWFADTAILPGEFKAFMTGIPFVSVEKVSRTIILAATDPAPESHGAAYTIPDERQVIRIAHQEINDGVYLLLSNRVKRLMGIRQTMNTAKGILSLIFRSLIFKVLLFFFVFYKGYQYGLQ